MTKILCQECGHTIDEHRGNETFDGCVMCACMLLPSVIAQAAIEAERERVHIWYATNTEYHVIESAADDPISLNSAGAVVYREAPAVDWGETSDEYKRYASLANTKGDMSRWARGG